MINCDFVNASSFKLKISNRAKLLYFFMLSSADDKGFVDNIDELVELLDSNDRKFNSESDMALLPNTFETAINDLLERGYLFKFEDKYQNSIYLIKHWYLHNVIPKDRVRDSSYEKYLEGMIVNDDGEYEKIQVQDNCDTTATQLSTQIKGNKRKEKKNKLNEINNNMELTDNAPVVREENNSDSDSSSEDNEDGFDYSVIPEKWDFDHCNRAVKLHVRKLEGQEITPTQERYIEAYKKVYTRHE